MVMINAGTYIVADNGRYLIDKLAIELEAASCINSSMMVIERCRLEECVGRKSWILRWEMCGLGVATPTPYFILTEVKSLHKPRFAGF